MKRYIYIIEKNVINNLETAVRKLVATEEILKIKEKVINKENSFGVKITPHRTETITYVTEITTSTISEMRKEFINLVIKYNINLQYDYNNKRYLIIKEGEKREGVWKDSNLIFHELRPNMIEKETYEISFKPQEIDKENEEEIEIISDFTSYYKEWLDKFCKLCKYNNYYYALFVSFILTINKYVT